MPRARHLVLLLSAACVGASAIAACSSFGGSDGTAQDSDSGDESDAAPTSGDGSMGTSDATKSSPDGSVAGGDAGPDTGDIIHDGFEGNNVSDSCGGWSCSHCTLDVVSDITHTGGRACRICNVDTGNLLFASTTQAPVGNYTVEAYVYLPADGGLYADGAAPSLGTTAYYFDSMSEVVASLPANSVRPASDRWNLLQTSGTVGDAGARSAELWFYTDVNNGGCYVIDDVRYYVR